MRLSEQVWQMEMKGEMDLKFIIGRIQELEALLSKYFYTTKNFIKELEELNKK